MAEEAEELRREIEETRSALDEKLDRLGTRLREALDVQHQMHQHPWLAVGAAVTAGFVVGTLGGESREPGSASGLIDRSGSRTRPVAEPRRLNGGDGVLEHLYHEFDVLKDAAVLGLIDLVRTKLREQLPSMGRYLDEAAHQHGGTTRAFTGRAEPQGPVPAGVD